MLKEALSSLTGRKKVLFWAFEHKVGKPNFRLFKTEAVEVALREGNFTKDCSFLGTNGKFVKFPVLP